MTISSVMNKYFLFLLIMLVWGYSHANPVKEIYNVKDYGAKGDGKTIDSKSINQTIEAASASGGGTVYFPAGNYLSGSIHLRSNINLFIDQGAVIIAAPVIAENGYDQEEQGANNKYQDAGHSHWHNSLIWGEDLHDFTISGTGKIWGKDLYKDWVNNKQSANKSIALLRCHNVIIKDISILHGGWFAILATGTDNFTLDNVKMDTNRDGVDVDCCKNVHISNCTVNSPYDDGICLKSSFALGYARPTENITITNCQVSGYDEGTLLDGTFRRTENADYKHYPIGRIKFGTESNGGFKNITISNCVFDYCRGLALETVDGALLEDVTITNITMRDVVNDPLFLRLSARMRGPEGTPVGSLRRVIISNMMVYNANSGSSCTISGIPGHDIEDITLSNIHIYFKGSGTKEQANREVPENENKYPEPGMFGTSPAYGLFLRHVKNIKLSDIEFAYVEADQRPAIFLDDVKGADLFHVILQNEPGSSRIRLRNASDISIEQSKGLESRHIDHVEGKEY